MTNRGADKPKPPEPRVTITHSRDLRLEGTGHGRIQLADLEALTQEARRLGFADDARVSPLYLMSGAFTGGAGELIVVADAKKEIKR